jgi:hypothetical protein
MELGQVTTVAKQLEPVAQSNGFETAYQNEGVRYLAAVTDLA